MSLTFLDKIPKIAGYQTICSINKAGEITQMVHSQNQIMDTSADILANLLMGNAQHQIEYMYFEYQNLASAGDPVTPPAFNKSDGIEYFTGLEFSTSRDFLRVPVVFDNKVTTLGSGGNKLITFFAVTPGDDTGFWGKPFAAANNSAVYGGALVSAPKSSSQANDLVFARNYPSGAKVLKPTGEQIAMTWNIELALPT